MTRSLLLVNTSNHDNEDFVVTYYDRQDRTEENEFVPPIERTVVVRPGESLSLPPWRDSGRCDINVIAAEPADYGPGDRDARRPVPFIAGTDEEGMRQVYPNVEVSFR